jgi:TMEM175 potassium channel family protein
MLTKNRLEAFSDGVFAIAITLLVIEIRPPTPVEGESLARALWEQWPHYLGYFLSFLVLGVMWLNHHRIFEPAVRVDGIVLVLNLNLLLWAVLIPFPTAVVADFLRDGGDDAKTAVALYGGVILLAAISFTALFVGITREGIVDQLPTPEQVRAARLRFGLGVGVYTGAFLLSWLSPPLALAAHGTMAAYYLTEQSSRLNAPARSDPEADLGS